MTIADIAPTANGTDAAAPIYRAQGVTRTYRQKARTVKALTGVDLTIDPGEFVTIQGPLEEANRRCCNCWERSTSRLRGR